MSMCTVEKRTHRLTRGLRAEGSHQGRALLNSRRMTYLELEGMLDLREWEIDVDVAAGERSEDTESTMRRIA